MYCQRDDARVQRVARAPIGREPVRQAATRLLLPRGRDAQLRLGAEQLLSFVHLFLCSFALLTSNFDQRVEEDRDKMSM